MVKAYVPDRGDIVWLSLDPSKGHEQSGRRPTLVLSPSGYNRRTGMALFCPLTKSKKDYPFEVSTAVGGLESVILADQIRAMDWKIRRCERLGKVSSEELREVQKKLCELIKG